MHLEKIQAQISRLYTNELRLQPLTDRHSDRTAYKHFEIDYKKSKQLLFCLGDSYTKGCGLETAKNLPELIVQNRFGQIVSDQLNADLINAGGGGFSNSWVFVNLEFMINWLNESDYTNGYIVITLTENGRDVQTASHRMFDYKKTYKDTSTNKLYDTVLQDIENEWIGRIKEIRKKLDPRFTIICGSHFVWHYALYQQIFTIDGIHWIKDTWIELLARSLLKSAPPRVGMVNLNHIASINDILGIQDLSHYKKWFIKNIDKAEEVIQWMTSTPEYFEQHDNTHPNDAGHAVWASAIVEKIREINAHF